MNAPTLKLKGVEPAYGAHEVPPLDIILFRAAMRGEVALSDALGCEAIAAAELPRKPNLNVMAANRRLATDHVQRFARQAAAAMSAALARAEQVAERGTGAEAHAALAEISDRIATTLGSVAR